MSTGSRRQRSYSYAYSKFVNQPDDLEGLIAYALFKAAKVHYCRKHFEENQTDLRDEEAKRWSDDHSTDHYVRLYRNSANNIINNYANIVVTRETIKLRKSILDEELRRLTDSLSGLTGWKGFGSNTLTGLAASFLFILIGFVIIAVNKGNIPWPFSELQASPPEMRQAGEN
jgi:hypothetical protein